MYVKIHLVGGNALFIFVSIYLGFWVDLQKFVNIHGEVYNQLFD